MLVLFYCYSKIPVKFEMKWNSPCVLLFTCNDTRKITKMINQVIEEKIGFFKRNVKIYKK